MPRAANTAEHQALLAWRLTPRDKWLIRMLHEHRVLTATQITALAFPSARSARMRLRELFQWSVADRFQPYAATGAAPMHYVLAPAGAAILAAEDGLDVKQLKYRHARALAIAHSLRLAHTVAVGDWFTALVAAARADATGDAWAEAWWSETRCARYFGDWINPDAYGRWRHHQRQIEFFLEFDFSTEVLAKLANKLTGYATLARSTGITTPVLVWLASARREATARRVLHHAWRALDDPRTVPVATATADLLNPNSAHPSPADAVWLPLESPGGPTARRALHQLPDVWPHIPPPATTAETSPPRTPPGGTLPAPPPMPPMGSGPPARGA